MIWDIPGNIETLKQLWAEGLSASLIAERIPGATRNSIVAKIDRLRKLGGPDAPQPRLGHAWKGNKGLKIRHATRTPPPKPVSGQKDVKPYVEKHARVFDPRKLVTMDELEDRHCRFPVGDPRDSVGFRFCGERRITGGPYCGECTVVSRAPVKIDGRPLILSAGGEIQNLGPDVAKEQFPAAGGASERELEEA